MPITAMVISAAALKDGQITSELDLRSAAVGLQVRATINSNELNFAARGASQDGFSGTRPGVLPYINEVQISGSGAATEFYDLGSVQVLMGPQGTLFGRSATGGAVLFQTAKPTDQFEGYLSGVGGNLSALKFEGAVSGPIAGDTLQGRLAGVYSKRDGFQQNIVYGSTEGDYKRYGLRGSLRYAPNENLTNDLVGDYFKSDSINAVGVISGLLPLTTPGQPPFVPAELLYGGVTNPAARAAGIATLQAFLAAANLPPSTIAAAYDAYFADPRRPAGGITQYLADQQARGPFLTGTESTSTYTAKKIVVTNTTSYAFGDAITLKNIFGYVKADSTIADDTDGTPYVVGGEQSRTITPLRGGNIINTKALSDELQVQGKTSGGVDYVGGVYLSDEKSDYHFRTDFFDILAFPFGGPPAQTFNFFRITNKTLAPFGQVTVPLSDAGVSATVGARYTSEKVGKERLPGDIGFGIGQDDDKARTFDTLNWTLGLQWQVNSDTLLYATSRRAFKSGGYNGSVGFDGPAAAGGDEYNKESVTDVELGAKFNGMVGGRQLRASVAVYHNWLKDSQRTAFTIIAGGPAAVTVNVPTGSVEGIEAELAYRATNALTLGGNVNFLNAKFSDGRVIVNGGPVTYDRLPDAPKYSFAAYGDLRLHASSAIDAIVHAEAYGQGTTYTSPRSANFAGTTIPSYVIFNLRAGIENSAAGWTLMANVKNAFDKTYYVGGVSAGEIYQINTLVPAEPRTFTLEARYKF